MLPLGIPGQSRTHYCYDNRLNCAGENLNLTHRTRSLSCRHSVFLRTLPRYLTLPLRHAPTCHGNGREPNELTEHHRTEFLQRTVLLPFIPFWEVMNKE